jgi:hypothetical protein
MNETIIMRLAWYKTLINSVTYVADTPIGSYEIDVITDNVSAMSSGGFGTTHYQNTTNDNRKHKRQYTHYTRHYL